MGTRTAITALLALLLVGCGVGDAAASLDRQTFLSTSVTENGADRPLVAGTRIRIGFDEGRVSASAGCNSMGGTYRIDGGVLIVDDLAMTEMGCDQDRHAQDEWLAAFLGGRPTVRLSGDELALEVGGTVIRLLDREVADPDLALIGPLWTVNSIITGDVVSSVPVGVVATLRFGGDGQVAVQTGCNQGGARVTVENGTLRFADLVMTEMACDGPAGEMEQAVLTVVQTAVPVGYEIEARGLTLVAGASGLGLQGG